MTSMYALVLDAFTPINRHVYQFVLLVYHIYISLPHLPLVRKIIEFCQPHLPEDYKQRKCSTKELSTIQNGPESIATSISVTTSGPLERQITCLCEDAAQILVWAAQTPRLEKLIIYDKSCLLSINGLELYHTIAATLDKLPRTQQRDLSTRYANQNGLSMDLEVVFTNPNIFDPEPVDLFVSFDGMSHGYPLAGMVDAVIFTPYRRFLAGHRPQLLEYISALKTYEQVVRTTPYSPSYRVD